MRVRIQGLRARSGAGPITRVLVSLLLILVVAVAVFFGLIFLVILAGILMILFVIFYVRTWWLRRRPVIHAHPRPQHQRDGGVTIDGEYTVEDAEPGKSKPDDRA